MPGAQFMGRWSNVDAVGNGYLSLGMSGGTPDHLFWSYASVRIVGASTCTGTFIGPNVLLTAGHCGHFGFSGRPSQPFNAMLYSEGSENANQAVLTSQCETLVQRIGLGDTHLVYCEDVSWLSHNVPPGHLLGMADFDLGPLGVGEAVWTSWRNTSCPGWDSNPSYNPRQCPGPSQMIFSPGQVTKIEAGGVYGADGVVTDQLMNQGASGGAIWRQTAGSSHRLVSSGITNGPSLPGQEAQGGFKAATITTALQVAMPDPTRGVNEALLQRTDIGLAGAAGTPWTVASYYGLMDSDQNGFFDVQERLDNIRGIYTASDTTWLGFESPRRNRMWLTNPTANVTFQDEHLYAHIDYAAQGDEVVMEMRNRQLAIDPTQTYRVRFKVRSFPQGAGPGTGLVVLGSGAAGGGPTGDPNVEQYYVDESFDIKDSWEWVESSPFQAAAGDNLLKFGHVQGEPEYLVDDVQIVQQ